MQEAIEKEMILSKVRMLSDSINLMPDAQGWCSPRDWFIQCLEEVVSQTTDEESIYFGCITATCEQLKKALELASATKPI